MPGPAWAADGAPSPGAWIFVSLALLLVAVASFAAGHYRSRSGARPEDRPSTTLPAPPPAAPDEPGAGIAAFGRWIDGAEADPRPMLWFGPGSAPGGRRLLKANAAARQLLGIEAGSPHAWSELADKAPASLRKALAEPPGISAAWWMLGDPHDHCLVLGSVDPGVAGEEASLAYTVSHDLRAPIRVVEGFTRIVKEDYGRQLDRVGNDHLDRVLAAASRMNLMIDAMLSMARLATQPLARQPVDLSQLAGFIVDDLRRAAPERQAEVQIQPGLGAQGDPTLLRLVLENLLGNAWKYTAHCSLARIEFGAEPHEGRVCYVVRDNGAGFDMRLADRLFGLFQRLHSAKDFPGTGVGLASVKRIVQRHGGQIWAQSEPGRGSTFAFTLRD